MRNRKYKHRKDAVMPSVSSVLLLTLLLHTGTALSRPDVGFPDTVEDLKKAARDGDPTAQYNLGLCYSQGDLVARDFEEAAKWFHRAADQGLAEAQYDLGRCYENGLGVTKDEVEGVRWYRKASDRGHAMAKNNLGNCLKLGRGVAKDLAAAVHLYREAVEAGDAGAQYNLGLCYMRGLGVEKDACTAVKLFRSAAEQGLWLAQMNLGVHYGNGDGVTKDYVEAYKWTDLALPANHQTAKRNLAFLESQMTPEQIAEGQRLAREFKPRISSRSGVRSQGENDGFAAGPIASGTGFFVTEDGFLITNAHVVKGASAIRLVAVGGFLKAKVLNVDPANDLALLKAEGMTHAAALPIGSSRTARLGMSVATIGFPNIGLQGFAPKFARGEIAALTGAADDARYFQISVPIQPGNSGGALVDERGNVIGVVSAKLDAFAALNSSGALPENVNYAVKSSFLLSFLEAVPAISEKLKAPLGKEQKFEDVAKCAEQAAALVLVY